MCDYCNYESEKNEIFQDMVGDYYLDVNTYEWDEYDDDYIHRKLYINYCPYCGRDLYAVDKKEENVAEWIVDDFLKKEEKPVEEDDISELDDKYKDLVSRLLREYQLSNPYPTNCPPYPGYYPVSQQTSYVPKCCRGCSKHPSNGGDGICNCTAPLFDSSNPYRITC